MSSVNQKIESAKKPIGGTNTMSSVNQKIESAKKPIGGTNTMSSVNQKIESAKKPIGGTNTMSSVNQKIESAKNLNSKQGGLSKIKNNNQTIDNYKPSSYKSIKNQEYSKVKEYILKNGGHIETNKGQTEIQKNSYREIVIPMDSKSKTKSSKKNGGKKKNSKSKKRSSKKKSNIKIKSSAPNNLKNDIDNLIRSSKKMSFHRI